MLKTALTASCGLLLMTAASPAGEKTHEWPMIGGNAAWTGSTPDERVRPPFRLKWASQPGEAQRSDITVAGGKVFARGCCLDAETGEVIWKAVLDPSAPTYHRGKLYLGRGKLRAYDANTGKFLWIKNGYSPYRGARTGVTVADGVIYCGRIAEHEGKKSYFACALKAETGDVIWSTPLAAVQGKPAKGYELGNGMGSMTVAGKLALVTTHNPRMVLALDRKTGRELWRREGVWGQRGLSTDAKTVWVADEEQGVVALGAEDGKILWRWGGTKESRLKAHYLHLGTANHPPALADGRLVLCNYGREYPALDAKTGKELWVAGDNDCQVWAGGCGPPSLAGGHVYSSGLTGKDYNGKLYRFGLYAADCRNGKLVWKHPLGSKTCARVAIAYGRLYAVGTTEISCFEPVGPDYKAPQPQAAPATPAAAPAPMAKPFGGKPGEAAAGGKPAGGTAWPMYGGCAARCGLELKAGLPVKEAWTFKAGDKVRSSPAILAGIVYVGSDAGELLALDLSAGTKRWSAKLGSRVRCAPAVAGATVICGADDGVLRAFDAKTGAPKWQFRTAGPVRSSPAIVGDRVVFGSWDGHCYCVRLSDGKEFWRHRVGDPGVRVYAPPAIAAGRVYVAAWEDRKVHALDLGTGKPLAGYKAGNPYVTKVDLVQGLAVYRGLVVTCKEHKGAGQLINPDTGSVVSTFMGRSSLLPALPAFSGDRVYHPAAHFPSRLSAMLARGRKPPAGKRPRGISFKSPVLNAPLLAGELLVAATKAGTLEVRRLPEAKTDGPAELAWEWKSASGSEIHTAPAAAAGRIVIGSDDGHVYAFSYAKQ
ncbi:MAG: outer membrane protein assembly factor BamB family protein [Planctomycetota bacterium]|jgi:outer membrane protein assembly factor BamB